MKQEYQFFAFISYNSHDTAWGKKLQSKLERYRMPATLCREHGWKRKPIRPVFFAPTDIQPGALSEELQERLRASRHLIVICSPHSARSEWVGREIAFFHSLGRTDCPKFWQPTSTKRYIAGRGSTVSVPMCNSSRNCSAWSLTRYGSATAGNFAGGSWPGV